VLALGKLLEAARVRGMLGAPPPGIAVSAR
jgi:hypothetical protein